MGRGCTSRKYIVFTVLTLSVIVCSAPDLIFYLLVGFVPKFWNQKFYKAAGLMYSCETVVDPVMLVLVLEFEREKRGILKLAKKLCPQCLPSKRTEDLIKKVDAATDVDNPPTLDQMAERYDVSEMTIRRILSKNLKSDLLKKTKTHALSNKQAQQRLDRGPLFLKLLGGDRWKNVVPFDEFWLSMNDCGGIRDCYYRKKGKPVPESRTKNLKQTFPKKVMCAAGVSYSGATGIYFVPPTNKINSAFFLNNIVKPMVEKDVPRFFPGEEHKVILHFDSASSHTTPARGQWYNVEHHRRILVTERHIHKPDWIISLPVRDSTRLGFPHIRHSHHHHTAVQPHHLRPVAQQRALCPAAYMPNRSLLHGRVTIVLIGPLGHLPYTPVNTFINIFIGISVLTWINSAVIFANFAISVDRWLSVEFVVKYRASITHRKALVAGILTTFGATLILNVPGSIVFRNNQHFEPCAGLRTNALPGDVVFLIWLTVKGPVLFPLLFLSQLRIMIVAVRLKLQAYRRRHRLEVLPAGQAPPCEILVIYWGSFMCSMTIVFSTLISNIPNYIMIIVKGAPPSARLAGVYMTLVQHCISPVIYLLFWPLYRQAVIRLFRRVRAVVRAVIKPNTRVDPHSRKRRQPQIPQIPG
ncbi:hypothetical protein BV898_15654 [Hypsibius exemplaris]|uniref:G-protein coupled receptors family 1 profile domain-containing protein n=1 Tax=Hypsibius exemplaris TaxID=2072580 RepID=A0A9X6NC08_HYPEX|nr:hypothetical protein BV898_15654 [Hypsibius exemplaris]